MVTFYDVLFGGIHALEDYLSAHVLACLVPAFFIAGGIAAYISKGSVLKYFGAQAKKHVSYGVASVSGTVLAVCSCTVIPLFAGIYRQGAGLGPATTFLFSGPAINLLAIVYTARLLGLELGVARAVAAVVFSIVLGLAMAFIYRKEELERASSNMHIPDQEGKTTRQLLIYFGIMVGVLIVGSAGYIDQGIRLGLLAVLLAGLAVVLNRWFNREEIKLWMSETYDLFKMIIPLILIGVFIAGAIRVVVPETLVTTYLGGNSLEANLIASLFGAVMYFATLTEVPIIKALMELGMGQGPALALLLAGPALSFPNMLAIRKVLGTEKTVVYLILVVVFATGIGMTFGHITR